MNKLRKIFMSLLVLPLVLLCGCGGGRGPRRAAGRDRS